MANASLDAKNCFVAKLAATISLYSRKNPTKFPTVAKTATPLLNTSKSDADFPEQLSDKIYVYQKSKLIHFY